MINVLTLIFITLKLMGHIDWHWGLVLLPTILNVAVYICYHIWWENLPYEEKVLRSLRRRK